MGKEKPRFWALPGAAKAVTAVGAVLAVVIVVGLITDGGDDGGGSTAGGSGDVLPPEPAQQSGFDKANSPSYDGADLAGFARYTAENEPGNCSSSYINRVRRFASDTFTYQPLVFPEDTEEFIALFRSACTAAGHRIR